ncbi:MAG: FMN-binding protein [Herbiconiux sp.]|uniref:FMN-binding protein n=1 Tax=Herbiconiux sp. TaxID=1871186 RepID=UPI00122A91AF|nr:FMN-binding protein [Herbiconiux sp.]TAJ49851.1 MAG: FMN-binding protein [Herbiconiux sp.]
MRARAVVLGLLSSTAVLAVGWQLGAQGQQTQTAVAGTDASAASPSTVSGEAAAASPTATPTPAATSTPAATPTPTPTAASAAPAAPAASGVSGTFTGTAARTRYGDVQVEITVQNGSITDVTALQLTDQDSRSVSISNRAAPVLRQEVLSAQSANVKNVSGATYTTDGYLTSLQSALDQAGL